SVREGGAMPSDWNGGVRSGLASWGEVSWGKPARSYVRNVVIVGSGPAGLTASISAARANLKPLLIEGFSAGGLIPGGQLMFPTDVENYPGFPEKVTGQELMQRFREQAVHQGTEVVTAD